MLYSYIKPKKKSPITKEFWLLIVFFGLTMLMLSSTYIFLLYQDIATSTNIKKLLEDSKQTELSIYTTKLEIDSIETKVYAANDINIKNSVMKDSINNLFDLVPDTVTLSEAQILHNGLILYGITPNKDIYNFMLQAPLKSIFNKTYTSFYPAKNGWLNFVSTNYLEDEEMAHE
ncbi:MAG: hypothetical protein WC144_03375 [Sulfurimonas sp.]|jgi:hypothetical protein|nr:hypothetical protein [Sulfurimonadaceae bacterium]